MVIKTYNEIQTQADSLTRYELTEAIKRAKGVVAQAARDLGMPDRTLWHKIKTLKIDVEGLRG